MTHPDLLILELHLFALVVISICGRFKSHSHPSLDFCEKPALDVFLSSNDLFAPLQSVFLVNHSSEIALTNVVNNLLLTVHSELASVLMLLDLSTDFDTVDQCILLERLENYLVVFHRDLHWVHCYLN